MRSIGKITIAIMLLLCAVCVKSFAQTGTVVGTVTDQGGTPLPGATVEAASGGKRVNIAISDSIGKFVFRNLPPASYTFNVSMIGYDPKSFTGYKVAAGNNTPLSFVVSSNVSELNSVVVVGYGTRKRQDVTGAVAKADLQVQKQSPNANVMSSLRGTVPGLTVGQVGKAGTDPTIMVRGRNSISGTTSPLIVVDGLIYRGSLTSINPSDIASIDLLKDASAAAVYGSQASNGVILVTTKSGANGMDKLTVDYSGSYSIQDMTQKDMKPATGAQYVQKLGDWYLSESRDPNDPTKMNPNWDPTTKMPAIEGDNYKNGYEANWWDLMTNSRPRIQNHNIGLSGRSKKLRFYMGYGYFDQLNLIKGDNYRRNSIRINVEAKPADWLTVGAQTSLSINDYSGVSPTFSDIMLLKPYNLPYDPKTGQMLEFYAQTTTPTPIEILKRSRDLDRNLNLTGNFFVSIDIPYIKGLNYRVNFGNNYISANRFNYNAPSVEATAYKTYQTDYFLTLDNILTYKRDFGKHGVDLTLLYGAEVNNHDGTSTSAGGITNGALSYNRLDVGDPARLTTSNDMTILPWKEQALYQMARLSYSFDKKYILTGTVRRDGFSGFSATNKWATFPSLAFAWRMKEEEFLKPVSFLDDLKLRLSYGSTGNRTVGRYQTLAQMSVGLANGYLYGTSGGAQLGTFLNQLPNSALRWETTNSFNTGVDFSFLNNRLFGSLDLYFSNSKNLLNSRATPTITGFNTFLINIGKIQNRGQELNITGVPVAGKDFKWEVTANFFRNRNKVLDIDGTKKDLINGADPILSYFIGQPYGVVYDYKITGMYQIGDKIPDGLAQQGFKAGQYSIEDRNGDGKITPEDKQILGKLDPSYSLGISNSFSYKAFQLKFFINTIQGGKNGYLGAPGIMLQNPDNIRNNNGFVYDYWTPNNPNARYRSIAAYVATLGENFGPYLSRSFIRLQDVTLTYSLPEGVLSRLKVIRAASIYLNAQNLLTITKWDGWDPESNPPASQRSSLGLRMPGGMGLDQNGYPVMKNYSLGVNVTF
ncbi:TonB-linked outer membrane protein, SusC/RagA family [Chitinophaga jiangningensis]|uniref:TonB-linked outer membrane protein, SusC/RagA family n=1 Tax=Chitinophaga jiangningensis TaxID=1419482 RepID=A0A1M7J0J0_9BACT|nr:SusC/RagA family TonB-linked outer membrane protein [Chitinophaga jiangningensis]SHM46539.1 TonB-linked outer membrane protein, SusC/RagA family [Chitinophaga jiangningensis]